MKYVLEHRVSQKVKRICKKCGKDFLTFSKSKKTFCSKECYVLFAVGENACNWRGGKVKSICQLCGKEFYAPRWEAKRRLYCSKSCAGKIANKGRHFDCDLEKNPNWKGGKSFEPYPVDWTETLKEAIRQRDNYKCRMCGIPQCEAMEKLSVHHKDRDKKNLNPDNLVSLCRECHSKSHNSKKREVLKNERFDY